MIHISFSLSRDLKFHVNLKSTTLLNLLRENFVVIVVSIRLEG